MVKPSIHLSAYNILLVDDELYKAQTLLLPLKKRGFSITAIGSAEEALVLLEKKTFSVVVSDERMPKIRGVEFLTTLAKRYPDIVRILYTGFSDHTTAVEAINRGNIFRFISKSETVDKIALILEEAVYHYAHAERAKQEATETRALDKAEAALNVLRDVRYDWGNIVLTQQIHFKNLKERLATIEKKFGFDLSDLKERCEIANTEINHSLQEYFRNSFLDSTLTHAEDFVEEDLCLPVQLAMNTVSQKIDRDKIRLSCNYDKKTSFKAKIQRERLTAAVGLVLHNAVESIAEAGTIEIALGKVEREGNPFLEISITDSGKGIPPEIQDKIFEPLFKSSDKQGHMGIGLTFVKAILNDHGGEVHFESELGKGSTFTLCVPATDISLEPHSTLQ